MQKNIKISEPVFSTHENRYLRKVLQSGWLTQGKFVEKFEKLFAKKQKSKFALATTSCTTALHLILLSLDIKKGDEVIVPSFTWVSTVNSILYCGAKPIFVDISLGNFNASEEEILKKINKKTRAILIVNLFGYLFDVKKIKKKIQNKIKIIEDSACATGASINKSFSGQFSEAAAYSFHPRKIITTGEGGMVTTNSEKLYKKMLILRNHGAEPLKVNKPYAMAGFKHLGYNYRMSDLQGAVGYAQLLKLDKFLNFRRKYANFYKNELKDLNWLRTPNIPKNIKHGFQAYVCLINKEKSKYNRNSIIQKLYENKIFCRPGTHAVHNLNYYKKKYSIRSKDFPNSYFADQNSIALPLHNGMKLKDFKKIVKIIKSIQ